MNDLRSPPEGDRIELELDVLPVSVQAPKTARQAFREQVTAVVGTSSYLFTGDVSVEVEWLISEQVRYETDRSPDVDNILKPLLDALVGPEALLIDDNQVQHVSCSWIDWNRDAEALRVRIRFMLGEWAPKLGLAFVQFDHGLCLPIPLDAMREANLAWLEAYKGLLLARAEADKQGLPYQWSRVIMPKQRVFHRSRLRGFAVLSEQQFRERFPPVA